MVFGWRGLAGSVLVHRTVDAPSASVYPNVPSRPCGCIRYPVLPTYRKESDGLVRPSPPPALAGCGVDVRHAPCSRQASPSRSAASAHGVLCPFSRMRNVTHGRGVCHNRLRSPEQRILSLDANDCRVRLEPAASRSVGHRAGVGVAKERYLVDPASSHMLVSKIKPCMCKYELIQTVKLRMAH